MLSELLIRVVLPGGLLATSVMTLFMLLMKLLLKQRLNVVTVLGAMLTGHMRRSGRYGVTTGTVCFGSVVHYGVGFFFTALFTLAWHYNMFAVTLSSAVIMGAAAGTVGVLVWRGYFYISRYRPAIALSLWLMCIFAAHLLFAVIFFVYYALLH